MSGGGKGGKGSSGSATIDVTSTSNSVIDSTSDITSTSTNEVTSTSTNNVDSTATANLQVLGLDNIRLKADTSADNRTQLEMDLKPLQVDLCLKVGLDRFPSTFVCRPSMRHFGLTLFGMEVVGFNYSSEHKTIIEDMRGRAFVAGEVAGAVDRADQPHHGVRIRVGE
jgi:hypothetical protein